MTLTIPLNPELEKRLTARASAEGVEPGEYARRIIDQHLPYESARPSTQLSPEAIATLKVLEDWERENATSDPGEIARRVQEGEEFMQSLARSRIEMEGPNARKLWP